MLTQKVVNKTLADNWLANNSYDRQRSIRDHHVKFLLQEMQEGRYRKDSTISFGVLGHKHYLVNGYHTLHAISRGNIVISLTLEDIEVQSEEELAQLYGTYDRNLVRSYADVFQAYGFHEHGSLSRAEIKVVNAALPLILFGFPSHVWGNSLESIYLRSTTHRVQHFREWLPAAQDYFHAVKPSGKFFQMAFQRAAVCAVGCITFQYARDDAYAFWHGAALDDSLPLDDPRKTLLRYLQNNPIHKTHENPLYARAVASCWNAFSGHRTLSRIYIRDKTLPISIAQTPFTEREVFRYVTLD